MGKKITLAEYARRHERNLRACQIRAAGGGFETAYKSGKMWLIDEDEPYIDRRIKSGQYRNWRAKYSKGGEQDAKEERAGARGGCGSHKDRDKDRDEKS